MHGHRNLKLSAIRDTACELTLMNEDLCERIKQRGNKYLELPAQHLTLVSAFDDNSRRVNEADFCAYEITNYNY